MNQMQRADALYRRLGIFDHADCGNLKQCRRVRLLPHECSIAANLGCGGDKWARTADRVVRLHVTQRLAKRAEDAWSAT